MRRFRNIPKNSQQGLEAANKLQKKIAARATDHTKKKSVQQQLLHLYRLIYLAKHNNTTQLV